MGKLASVCFIGVLITSFAIPALGTKPTGPFDITMSLSETPILNKPVKLVVNVTTRANATNVSIEINTTDGITIIKGDSFLRREQLSTDEIIQFEITLKTIKTGYQEIGVIAFRNETWGSDGNSVNLYIDVTEKSARVSGRPFEPTPSPKKRTTEPLYYLFSIIVLMLILYWQIKLRKLK